MMLSRMTLATLVIRRAEFSIEEPWALPAGSARLHLFRSTDGTPPRLATTVAVYADSACLNILFHAQDDAVVARYWKHDQPLYEEDVVEVFLAPSQLTRYFEIEVNPLGTTFDARIDSPDGIRATMKTDLTWDCHGLFAAIRKVPGAIDTMVRIPFASIDSRSPERGQEWRANFFRIDRSPSRGDEFSAWQPTLKNPPDFHVPEAFGRLVFE
jgi:hypothetical protein